MGFSIGKVLGSVASPVGQVLNSITGATSASKASQKYALQSMKVQNAYEKEAAQNAHQWEVADLEKTGLNPILSGLGGSGASADTGISAGSQQASGIDILSSASGVAKTLAELPNFTKTGNQIDADTALKGAQAAEITAGLPFIPQQKKADVIKTLNDATLSSARTVSERGKGENIMGSIRHGFENAGIATKKDYENASESYKKNRNWMFKK